MSVHPPRRLGSRQTVSAVISGICLLGISACGGSNEAANAGAQQQQQAPGMQAARVEVVTVEPTSIGSVRELPGRATPYAEAEIRPQVTGLIESRLFTEGELVSEGQALYQIDADEYVAAVQSAQAALARAEAAAATAGETAKRFERLADINAVSQQSYDEAVAAQKQAEADVGIQKAALSRARIDLARTKVSSPIAGRIGRSNVTQGALVTANQPTSLARVLQLDPIYIDMTASSAEVLKWKQDVSQNKIRTVGPTSGRSAAVPVTLHFEDGTEYPERGTLEFSEVSVDMEAGTVIVRAQFPNPDNLILPGMFMKAHFAAGTYENVYVVPQRAVQRTPQGDATAFVVGPDNTAVVRQLTVQESNGSNWIVTDGFETGDRLVTSGFQNLRPGAPVTIIQKTDAEMTAMNGGQSAATPE
ncbi:efflux RND transporter periplasmic adaptor subunit [Henriciella litoralis]|uniref:efflux RND transporter periplasmic adaptor subunit n=1 Tax=Henriciella litoralis TaxID=568102 RepID=UPI000A036A22|nr:efflux RND transporter periplasmic adaptor subunit [Henriciella litoralis]